MTYKVLFTSDLHGNTMQYQKLIDYASEVSADCVIIGGDLTPKHFPDNAVISGQRHFLNKKLPRLLRLLKKKLPKSRLFLIMGNDDCAANLDVLEKGDPMVFHVIHKKRIKLTEEFDMVGYSYVPITPFGIKDWEKYDLSQTPKHCFAQYRLRKLTNYQLLGYKSSKDGWTEHRFEPSIERINSIQKDLRKRLFCDKPEKTVYVFHTPPNNTSLDMGPDGEHLGSFAVRLFIEKHQPYLTLHGHIHETVKRSGQYLQRIGKTLCMTAGNDDFDPEIGILNFDLHKPYDATREII